MLTREDCIALCGLTEEEVQTIAEHEHISDIIAAEMGSYLVHLPGGEKRVAAFIRDDIAAAQARGDYRHSAVLKHILSDFVAHHAGAGSTEPGCS